MIRHSFSILISLLLLAACSANKAPDWLHQQSVDRSFYSSTVAVSKQLPNYREYARETALRDISTQISVTITSDLQLRERENAGYLFAELAGTIQTSSNALLEDVELYRFAEDKKYYYALYRLSKMHYRAQREARKELAMQRALESLAAFDAATSGIVNATYALIEAIDALEPYADLDLSAAYDGSIQNLYTTAMSRLRALPPKIIPDWELDAIRAVAFRSEEITVRAAFVYHKSEAESYPVSSMPVVVSFTRGEGEIEVDDLTNSRGELELVIHRISSSLGRQELRLVGDLSAFVKRTSSPSLRSAIGQLPFETSRLLVAVSKPSIYLDFLAGSEDDKLLYEQLKGRLLDMDLDVTEQLAMADYILVIRVNVGQITFLQALSTYSASADMAISFKQATGELISSTSHPNIKGSGNSRELAAQRARQMAVRNLSEELLFRTIQTSLYNR